MWISVAKEMTIPYISDKEVADDIIKALKAVKNTLSPPMEATLSEPSPSRTFTISLGSKTLEPSNDFPNILIIKNKHNDIEGLIERDLLDSLIRQGDIVEINGYLQK